MIWIFESIKYTQIQTEEPMDFLTQQSFRENAYKLFDKNLLYSPWNKLYSAKYMSDNNLKFPQTWMDDFPFVLSFIRDVKKVVFNPKPYYHFMRARAESETAKYKSTLYEKREEEHQWMLDLYKYWDIKDDAKKAAAREMVVGCIENVTNPNCTLSKKERKAEIKRILNNPNVSEALKIAKPNSKYMKIMLLPVKWKNVTLCYLEGTLISRIKTKNVKLFAKLKANR